MKVSPTFWAAQGATIGWCITVLVYGFLGTMNDGALAAGAIPLLLWTIHFGWEKIKREHSE